MLDVWAEAGSFQQLTAALASLAPERSAPARDEGRSFKLQLDAWGHTWGAAQQEELLQGLGDALPWAGPVDLRTPDMVFWCVCVRGDGTNGLTPTPERWYFGRQVALADR